MIVKTFEVRDRATFIPMLAVKLESDCKADQYLLQRAGYSRDHVYIMLCGLNGGIDRATSDPFDYPSDARTRPVAHKFIEANFDALESGAVVDVEFILGETTEAKLSEAIS